MNKLQQHFSLTRIIFKPETSEDPTQGLKPVTYEELIEFLEAEKC